MSPMLQMDASEVQKFIYNRVSSHPTFRAVIAVSVDKYPGEFSATVWLGQEPDTEMRKYAYELEADLGNLGVPCSIVLKTDRELAFGGTYELRTKKGEFTYRHYRIDPVKDEDFVYIFTLYLGPQTYRFRVSLTRTLASMLRQRSRFEENRILEVYLGWIRERIEGDDLEADRIEDHMFNSRHLDLFVGN
jgi:hypothetical protein